MANNFTTTIHFDGRSETAVILVDLRKNGMHFEVNIKGYPRFYMKWSELDRYDVINGKDYKLPINLVLAVSDAIEKYGKR